MDPAPKNSTEPAPRKTSREPRRRLLGSLHKTSSSAKLPQYNLQDTSHAITPNPAICITPEQSSTDPIKLQRTFSSLLRSSSGHEETQSLSPESYFECEKDLKQPLLHIEKNSNKKSVPNLLLKNKEKSSSWSESPSTSPRKKSSPSQHSHKKLTSSSPYGSPRDAKSSHSSPRELVTYDDVIEAFTQKSKITKTVKFFLQNKDNNLNQQDKTTGLTILHRAVLLHHKVTHLLLCNPEIDSFIEDNNSQKASDFIKDEIIKYEKLFNALKTREFVDLLIDALIITNEEMQDPCCSKDFMRKTIISFLKKTLPGTLPNYADGDFFIDAIYHRKTHKLSLLQEFCKQFKTNPNYQDKHGNTMWHYAAIALDEQSLKQLASNPYVNSSLRNKESRLAVQLIPASNNIKTKYLTPDITEKIHYLKGLRTLLFTRDSLEFLAEKQAHTIATLTCPIISKFTFYKKIENELDSTVTVKTIINPDVIEAKELIEKDFKDIAQKQGDSDLPKETEFPSYATKKFTHKIVKRKMEAIKTASSPENQEKLLQLFASLTKDYEQSQLILDGETKLDHIVIEKKSEQKKDQDTISKPITDQDPLVSKSSED
jgi:ankyrin repeat protein